MIKGPDTCLCTHHAECTCLRNLFQMKYYKHSEDEKHMVTHSEFRICFNDIWQKSVVVSIDRKNGSLAVSGHKSKRSVNFHLICYLCFLLIPLSARRKWRLNY